MLVSLICSFKVLLNICQAVHNSLFTHYQWRDGLDYPLLLGTLKSSLQPTPPTSSANPNDFVLPTKQTVSKRKPSSISVKSLAQLQIADKLKFKDSPFHQIVKVLGSLQVCIGKFQTSIPIPLFPYLYSHTSIPIPLFPYLYFHTSTSIPLLPYLYFHTPTFSFTKVNYVFTHNIFKNLYFIEGKTRQSTVKWDIKLSDKDRILIDEKNADNLNTHNIYLYMAYSDQINNGCSLRSNNSLGIPIDFPENLEIKINSIPFSI
ncbi:hypothetical protein AYI68_g6449, partial [Smittium mucronatum]